MKTKIINTPDMLKAASRKKSATVFMPATFDKKDQLEALVKGEKYYIHTYGCQANVRDEETMRGLLEDVGYKQTDKPEEASLIIINTCAVRENAEDKVYGEIGNLKHLRKKNKDLVLAICGCMVEQPEILKKLMETFTEVNLYFGTHEIAQLYSLVYDVRTTKERVVAIESCPVLTPGLNDFLKDAKPSEIFKGQKRIPRDLELNLFDDGTGRVAYYYRGMPEARKRECSVSCVKIGAKQIKSDASVFFQSNLSQDLDEGKDFADLMEAVAKLGVPRLRFTTSHPWDFSSKMIDVIAKYPNIMKFIHLPVQSGNDRVLKAMGRRYTRETYLALVKEMREKIPGLALSTDIIVGFPNETDEEFNDTLTIVDEIKYENKVQKIYGTC